MSILMKLICLSHSISVTTYFQHLGLFRFETARRSVYAEALELLIEAAKVLKKKIDNYNK